MTSFVKEVTDETMLSTLDSTFFSIFSVTWKKLKTEKMSYFALTEVEDGIKTKAQKTGSLAFF